MDAKPETHEVIPQKPEAQVRPGCVTAWAVILWIGAAFSLLGLVTGGNLDQGDIPAQYRSLLSVIAVGCTIPYAAVLIAAGMGLWKMKRWGWWLGIAVLALGLVNGLLSVLSAGGTSQIVQGAATVVIAAAILFWVAKNRSFFVAPS